MASAPFISLYCILVAPAPDTPDKQIKQIQYPKNIAKILTDPKSGSQRNNRKTFMIKKNQFFDFGVKVFLKNRLIRKIKVPSKLLNILTVSRVLSQSTWSFAK